MLMGCLYDVKQTLQLLSLKANRIGHVGATRLAQVINNVHTFEYVCVSANVLCQALEANASLQSLLLGGNSIMGPDGAKPLGNMLTFNDSLTSLDLSDCGVYKEVVLLCICMQYVCMYLKE